MDTGQHIAAEACRLAKAFPFSVVEKLAVEIGKVGNADWSDFRNQVLHIIPQPHYRNLAGAFLDECQAQAAMPKAVSLALLTAAQAEKTHREDQSVELVWTGPDVGVVALRRTEQALLQVIDAASQRITIVAYAVFRIPRIREALVRAADRGVQINVVVETPDRLEGENTYDTLRALGQSVSQRSTVYYWPLEQRDKDDSGKPGILHVKCAVADGRWLFLSSANLTEYAFTTNMELGLLLTGGDLPEQVQRHFDRMIQTGLLMKV